MTRSKSRTSQRNSSIRLQIHILAEIALVFSAALFLPLESISQTVAGTEPCRIGERLTYNVAIGRYKNAAYAEMHCVSRGRLGEKDAVELRAQFRTLDLASAAFYLIDESRTTFVSPSTGLPLYASITQNAFGLPKETAQNFSAAPTPHADLLTMIYKLRHSAGNGSLTMQSGEKVYTVVFTPGVAEKQKTDVGEYETIVVGVQSEYFTELGITEVRVNLSSDEAKIPVLIRFRTGKGVLRASLASLQMIEPEVTAQATPAASRTPLPERTPKPVVTPTPYVDNLPLASELAFELGERLEYRIQSGGQQVATMRLAAKERREFNGLDSLLLEASFSDNRPGSPFVNGDFVKAHVSPDLAPLQLEMRFGGSLRAFSKIVKFAPDGSSITFGANPIDAPVGTHSILSLLYALRSFNLKPSRDLSNPINDTRVAVFWESQPYIFTLRPSPPEVITMDGKAVAAQQVVVSTKNAILDQLSIRVWLGNDNARIPLRFSVGSYQAELISAAKVLPN